jgi:hypothetical protein
LANFCPEWVFSICCAQTANSFLTSNNSISAIAKNFSFGLSEKYNEVKFEEIIDLAENTLQFLSEIQAGEDATIYLVDYIHYRTKFQANGSERKLSGLFSSAFDGEKIKNYNPKTTFKIFKATVFSIRNNAIPKASPGWVITDEPDIDWLGELFIKEIDLF